MCTSLAYRDANNNTYFGRTLELSMELPYQLAYFPAGETFRSVAGEQPPLEYRGRYSILAIAMPERAATADAPLGPDDFKILEGMNEQGLTFSLLAYPSSQGGRHAARMTRAMLSASDLGSWTLSQFSSVAQVKEALAKQTVSMVKLALLGGAESPFHYVLHDRSGACIVIEFVAGKQHVYDNPVGVMTNGPEFPWHLTNLNNYTYLCNVDRSEAAFGDFKARQPDSGIATAGLPASNTSVGRFVRAAYYAQYTEAVEEPTAAVGALAHIMNNFDRPRGISIADNHGAGGLDLESMGGGETGVNSEYTSWTSLSDLQRGQFFVRDYQSLNYVQFDLGALQKLEAAVVVPLARFSGLAGDQTAGLSASVR
jgi:penicillin V acylase-like amidase (Ntn superfamily)